VLIWHPMFTSKWKDFEKYKLKDKLEKYDSTLTATENMYENDYRKIYDSGNLVYLYIKK